LKEEQISRLNRRTFRLSNHSY